VNDQNQDDVTFNDDEDHYRIRVQMELHVPQGTNFADVVRGVAPDSGDVNVVPGARLEVQLFHIDKGVPEDVTETTVVRVNGVEDLEGLPPEVRAALRNVIRDLGDNDDDDGPRTH
jgi:hypothetical protein